MDLFGCEPRVAISNNASEPLAVRLGIGGKHPAAAEIFVNGRVCAHGRRFPAGRCARVFAALQCSSICRRAWLILVRRRWWPFARGTCRGRQLYGRARMQPQPSSKRTVRTTRSSGGADVIGSASTIRAVDRAERLSELLGSVPDLALNALLGLVGLGLIVVWRLTRRAELAWCSALLIFNPIYEYFFVATDQGYLSIRYWEWGLLFVLFSLSTMLVTVEFVRTVHGLRGGMWRWAAHGCWIVTSAGELASISDGTSIGRASRCVGDDDLERADLQPDHGRREPVGAVREAIQPGYCGSDGNGFARGPGGSLRFSSALGGGLHRH